MTEKLLAFPKTIYQGGEGTVVQFDFENSDIDIGQRCMNMNLRVFLGALMGFVEEPDFCIQPRNIESIYGKTPILLPLRVEYNADWRTVVISQYWRWAFRHASYQKLVEAVPEDFAIP